MVSWVLGIVDGSSLSLFLGFFESLTILLSCLLFEGLVSFTSEGLPSVFYFVSLILHLTI